MNELKNDIILFTNDLAEYHQTPEGRAFIKAFYASDWGDYDLPESRYMADELGGIPQAQADELTMLLSDYWTARNK